MAEALALQRRFVADASHELRTPLTLLSTRAQLLRRRIRSAGRTDDALLRDVDGIVADTKALTDILEELLLAADTRAEVPRVTVDVAALVAAVVAAAAAEADRRGVQLTLRSDEPVRLSAGAPTALKRAVTALIDNALTHAKGQVRVTVTRLATEVVISVRDDGPGLDEDSVPQMFARFASDRREPAAASGRRHYGLGLALVSEVAARHGGRVLAENVPGPQTGADVRLILPSRR
nr:HAMP domain-containing sensor histidine kinase [Microlunatus panaciterrae]